jgi:kinesin family protein 6/9
MMSNNDGYIELSEARQVAFDHYRHSIANTTLLNKHKEMLKMKYTEAKSLGEKVNKSRLLINQLKCKLEKYEISRRLQDGPTLTDTEGENDARVLLEKEKSQFKELYGRLKELKNEIEHLQHLMDKAKLQLQQDFEVWWKTYQGTSDGGGGEESSRERKPMEGASKSNMLLPSLIGDSQTDDDIKAFYKARQKLLINKRIKE